MNINANSIVEFNDPKHGNGAAPPILGIVQGVSDLAVQPFDPDAASAPSPLVPAHMPSCHVRETSFSFFALQVEYKAKGGARIQVMDVGGSMHTVPEKDIHINLGVYKGKLVEPAEILADYVKVMDTEPMALGVEPELLEMAS